MLEHTHTETELTCVLQGSLSHEGGRFGPGDASIDHQPSWGGRSLRLSRGNERQTPHHGSLGRLIECSSVFGAGLIQKFRPVVYSLAGFQFIWKRPPSY
jgi:hypothetical protein